MTDTALTFMRVTAIPAERLRRIRATNRDDNGEAPAYRVDDDGGAPLRCCLRDAEPGERIALIGYRPFDRPGPYAEVGPVFIHADECAGYPATDRYPDGFRSRRQVFRGYRADGTIAGGALAEPGHGHESLIRELFSDAEVACVHSRNVIYGCFMFEISRPASAEPKA